MGRAVIIFEKMYALAEDQLKQELTEALAKLNITENDLSLYKPRNADEAKLIRRMQTNIKILGRNK
jgi:hypothetical protein